MNTSNKQILGITIAVLAGSLTFTSCHTKERDQLRAQADSLQFILHERDSAFNSIMTIMADVESQIQTIKDEENLISTNSSGDFTPEDKTQMVSDLQRINQLIDDTNNKVASLSSQLNNSNLELKAFKSRVAGLKKDLETRESSIAQLQSEVEAKDAKIAELNTEVESLVTRVNLQTQTIEDQNNEITNKTNVMNTAYFAVDTQKKLEEEGLISKEGGFLGLGKTTELKANAAQSKFTEVDIRNTKRFYIDSNKIEIVTEHPSGSYKLVSEGEKVKYLEVLDAEKFWKISKYLVISVKS